MSSLGAPQRKIWDHLKQNKESILTLLRLILSAGALIFAFILGSGMLRGCTLNGTIL